MKKRPDPVCSYHKHAGYYNHAGALPCGDCGECRAEAASLARLHKWNADTAAGASPTR